MAFGFPPKFSRTFELRDLSPEQFLALSVETIKKMNWSIAYLNSSDLIAYTDVEMFAWKAEFMITIKDGKSTITSSSMGSELWDFGKNKSKIDEFIYVFNKIKSNYTPEDLKIVYDHLTESFSREENDILVRHGESAAINHGGILTAFIPSRNFLVTPLLIDLNILIFIIMAISGISILQPTGEDILKWGGNFRPSTLDGEWWRLLTNCFLHIGIIHLLMNMYALLYIGILLEPIIGRSRFLISYLLTGVAASSTSIIWHPLTVSAGASGAIFGMYGLFLALLTTDLIEKTSRKALFTSIGIFVLYNLVYGLKGGIDNSAHVGGLVSGILIGFTFLSSLREPDEDEMRYRSLIYSSIAVVAFAIITLKSIPNDFKTYELKMTQFASIEAMAIEPLKQNNNIQLDSIGRPIFQTKEMLLNDIKNRGIYFWNECVKITNDISKLKLTPEIQERNKLVQEYCQLRVKVYELIYKSLDQNSPMYNVQIENYNKQIEVLVNKIKSTDFGG